jgi:RimJ/RimL family protein N-acetyltransferase
LPHVQQLNSDPEASRWINPVPAETAAEWIRWAEKVRRRGEGLLQVIAEADSGDYLGEIIVMPRGPQRVELGYVVGPPARGRGIATQAVRLVTAWAFAGLGAQRVELFINPANTASQRVAEKAGFTREGVLRSHWLHRPSGERHDSVAYSRLPGDPGPDSGQ